MKEFDLDYVKQHWDEAQEYGLIQTRHGEDVKLTSIDLSSERSISGIAIFQGEEVVVTWRREGHYSPIHNDDPNDLVIKE
jgi:hypothetical protein